MTTYLSGERIQGSSTTKTHTTLTFNSNGTFTPSAGISVNYVVVGGGGGGARDAYSGQRGSGGGGAGAYRESGVTSSDTAFTSSNTAYTITVGTGGTGGGASPDTSEASVAGGNGNNSSISGSGLTTITSNGGGGGGGHSTSSNYAGNANGNASGGGGSNGLSGGSGGTYGNNGGSGGGTPYSGGGGGGSNSTGSNGSGGNGGNGGSGKTPSTTYFSSSALAGGGGGNGGTSTGTGQAGGGSGSQSGSANAGTANTGGGGGGSRGFQAGAGGSGVVIISVPIGSSYSTTGSPTVGEAGSQDDKTTITNVPEGTRFEETDTRKIFRREVGALDNDTGLRFRYKFDEASGNVKNYGSVADADLTVSGLTRDVSTPSGLGNGMSTPNRNSNDYAENTSRVNDYKFMHDGTAKWSVTFWAYLTEVPRSGANTEHGCMGNVWTDDAGIGWTVRWAMDQSPSSTTSCRIQTFIAESNTTGSSTMPLNDQSPNGMMPELNAWHFYCVTYDPTLSSNHLTVSRDAATSGTGFHQGSEDNDTYSSSNPTREVTYFARATSSHDLGMGGRLAEVTIWEDKILTQAEKVALYSSGNGTTKLASSWKEKGTA